MKRDVRDRSSRQSAVPFVKDLCRHAYGARVSFHMPGHKQRPSRNPDLACLWGDGLFRSDLSEIGGLDYLHAPQGALRQAQALAAEAFGADATLFLVNGSTVGNHAALLSCVGAGQKVLMPRASHRSVYAGVLLSDAVPVFLPPLAHPDAAVPLAADLEPMEALLKAHPDIAAVHITSPSYYGTASDVAACARLAHRYGVPLLVDEAHGAHFGFHPALPPSALECGADLVIQSTHKTLGSLYQSSMLHLKRGRVDARRVEQVLAMLQSSSPSALLLASLDAARATMATEGRALLDQTVTLAEQARAKIRTLRGLWCYGHDLVGAGGVQAVDPTKLMIRVSGLRLTGFEARDLLREHHGVEVELADPEHVLCSLTLQDTAESVAALIHGLQHLPCLCGREGGRNQRALQACWPRMPEQAMGTRAATFAPSRPCAFREAMGQVCAESVIPYPPGIPVLLPGERIDAQALAFLEAWIAEGAHIVGAADPDLKTIQVVA